MRLLTSLGKREERIRKRKGMRGALENCRSTRDNLRSTYVRWQAAVAMGIYDVGLYLACDNGLCILL